MAGNTAHGLQWCVAGFIVWQQPRFCLGCQSRPCVPHCLAPIEVLVSGRARSRSANQGPALGTAEAYVTSSGRCHTNRGSAVGAFRIGSGGRMQRPASRRLMFCLRCVLLWQGRQDPLFCANPFFGCLPWQVTRFMVCSGMWQGSLSGSNRGFALGVNRGLGCRIAWNQSRFLPWVSIAGTSRGFAVGVNRGHQSKFCFGCLVHDIGQSKPGQPRARAPVRHRRC